MNDSTDEIRARLDDTREDIIARVEALQDELTGIYDGVVDTVRRKPVAILAGTVVAGIAVGLLIANRKRRGRGQLGKAQSGLVDAYTDAIVHHVERAVSDGRNAAEAVRDALRGRTPLVVIEAPEGKRESGGFLRQGLEYVVTTGLGYAARAMVEQLSTRFSFDRFVVNENEER